MFPKNARIHIKPLMNGYGVEYSYRVYRDDAKDQYDYNNRDEEYTFPSWDGVVNFVTSNPLDVPPI